MIHPTAIVHPSADIDRGAEIGPFCVVGPRVRVGARSKLLAHVVMNGRTTIGEDSVIHPFCSIGAESQDRKTVDDEVAETRIGSRTIIREYVSVHRATGHGEVTSIGDDCLILAYAHIAHNCRVGNFVTLSNLAQLAGHVVVEDHAGVGGMAGVHQFVRVGRYAFVGGYTKLTQDLPPYFLADGNPPQVYGLNAVGLRRAGFKRETLSELKEAYKTLYRSERNFTQALELVRQSAASDETRHLVAFLKGTSDRGILK